MKTKMKKLKDEENKRFTSYVNLIVKLRKLIINKNKRHKFDYEVILEGLIKNHIHNENLTAYGQKEAIKWIKNLVKEI